jgi:heat shock protein HslJ
MVGISRLLSALVLLSTTAIDTQTISAQAESNTTSRLANTEWRLTSFGPARNETVVLENTRITLKFGADGRAGGSSGCNTYGSDYRVRGNRLSFGSIISTKRACLDPQANQQEQRYFRALETANSFRLTGSRLTIFDNSGGSTLNFASESATQAQARYEDLTNPVAVLASFYNAVNAGEYDRAYRYWEIPPGRFEDFVRGYRDTLNVQLIVQPPTHIEGATGSLYVEVPTMIVGRRRDGMERIFAGCYVTRKSNLRADDSPGGGVWRIYRGRLSPVATSARIPKLLAQACRI